MQEIMLEIVGNVKVFTRNFFSFEIIYNLFCWLASQTKKLFSDELFKFYSVFFSCSVGKFVSFGTSLYTLVPAYGANNSWAMLSVATLLTFFLNLVAKIVLDRLYPHKLIDESLDEQAPIMKSALDAKTQVNKYIS